MNNYHSRVAATGYDEVSVIPGHWCLRGPKRPSTRRIQMAYGRWGLERGGGGGAVTDFALVPRIFKLFLLADIAIFMLSPDILTPQ